MKSLEKEVELYADRTIGFANENHWQWEDAQRHIINFCEQSKWIEAEKIKVRIEEINSIIACYDLSNETADDLRLKVNRLQQQLNKLEDETL
jgi:polyhydroxyalkanoate synthesis regulator phasin